MGWFGLGGSSNPLDKIEIPEDQLPPEVQKPQKNVASSVESAAKNQGMIFDVIFDILKKFLDGIHRPKLFFK